ncbi:MAG TPA: amino acid adenylation domain-containing protein, partial [Pyrinomonadaceae bacterium]|nr:amino acid adenylation domain-containing protein [Pyrinomonadaceae bacterium]
MSEAQQTARVASERVAPEKVASEDLLAQQLYWVNKLSGEWPETSLIVEVVELPKEAGEFQHYPFTLPADVSERIFKSSKRAELSIYSILVSALTIMLYKYTGQRDMVVGSPVYQPELRDGARNHLVPLRFQLEPQLAYKDYLLRRVRPTIIEAYGNQDYPFEKVVELLNLVPADGRSSAIDIVILLSNIHREAGLEDVGNSLTFIFHADEQAITGEVKYNASILRKETVEQFINHYTTLLRSLLQNVSTTLAEANPLTPEEEHELLIGFNETAASFPFDRTLSVLFEEQVAKTPHRPAVISDGQTHTYAELNTRANRMAHRLKALGVAPEVLVTLLSRRNTDLLTAILAVFKAGGAYLPLDPLYAPKRVAQVLSRSKSPLVLVSEELREAFAAALDNIAAEERPQVVLIEELLAAGGVEENPPSVCAPNNLAYVIYTSGSTGVPKGAMLEHRGMLNHLYLKIADLNLTEEDIVAQTASQSFDISVWQFLSILLVGGQVQIVADDVAHDPQQLLELVERDGVTILEIVPSLLGAALLEMNTIEDFRPSLSALRWLLVTGEALPPELCSQWLDIYPNVPLLNAYGPTECSDDVTHFALFEPLPEGYLQTPIGRPVANTQIYILNEALMPVPCGVPGEIYVGGVGVGRGYLGEQGRTAEVFIANPFSAEAGARLYKTGDLGRFHADGNIEFLGRVDQQVKIRGYRIELGEIETVMRHHPGVREAVVLARQDYGGEKRLVGYVVAAQEPALELDDLREFLLERLADYMVPTAFVRMDALPLSVNGKIDRRHLPAPERTASDLAQEYVEPRNAVEQKLAEIWAEVLRLENVGIHDNFFELGGDSILSIHIIAKANQAGLRLTPKQIFEHQTIAELAAVANTTSAVQAESGMVTGQIPLTPIQHWFFEQEMRDPHHFNQTIMLEVRQKLDPTALQ